MHGRKYVWVIHTPDRYGWWKRLYNGSTCTPEEVNEGAKGILYVNYMWLSSSQKTTEAGLVSDYDNSRKFSQQSVLFIGKTSINPLLT